MYFVIGALIFLGLYIEAKHKEDICFLGMILIILLWPILLGGSLQELADKKDYRNQKE